ncbi:hypothetical protein [Amycolatopsis sp. NPDC052450]|uniref:hypothetical protein n=1 Tax=Amycolatopsis sp. NPDC052450 TaxID=3363937 RepID=UPI0037C8F072
MQPNEPPAEPVNRNEVSDSQVTGVVFQAHTIHGDVRITSPRTWRRPSRPALVKTGWAVAAVAVGGYLVGPHAVNYLRYNTYFDQAPDVCAVVRADPDFPRWTAGAAEDGPQQIATGTRSCSWGKPNRLRLAVSVHLAESRSRAASGFNRLKDYTDAKRRYNVEPGYGDEALRLQLFKPNEFDSETDERLLFRLHNTSVDVEYFVGKDSPVDPLHAKNMVLEVAAMLDHKLREL